jgi:hypothetical protein
MTSSDEPSHEPEKSKASTQYLGITLNVPGGD